MCVSVYYGRKRLETVGQFRAALNAKRPDLVVDEHYDHIPQQDKICLCPVDVVASAKKFGFTATRDDDGDYTLYAPTVEAA